MEHPVLIMMSNKDKTALGSASYCMHATNLIETPLGMPNRNIRKTEIAITNSYARETTCNTEE